MQGLRQLALGEALCLPGLRDEGPGLSAVHAPLPFLWGTLYHSLSSLANQRSVEPRFFPEIPGFFHRIPLDKNVCSIYNQSQKEHLFDRRPSTMTTTTFLFVLTGIATLTAQVFRIIDAIERPARRTRKAY